MNREDAEKALHLLLSRQPEIHRLGGVISRGSCYGTLLTLGERPIGLWSVMEGKFAFRELSSYEPCIEVMSADEAVDVTIALLTLCQKGWAERFGPIADRRAAA
jgi:hypothetical protein